MQHVPYHIVPTRRGQHGIGLIELLLAVVLLSIGFLAAARMQMQSLAYTQNTYALSQAKFMALDMSERMRANPQGLRDGLYVDLETRADTVLPACVGSGARCNAVALRDADLHAWSVALHPGAGGAALLPTMGGVSPRGVITRDAATRVHDVTLTWPERVGSGYAARSLSVQVFPPR